MKLLYKCLLLLLTPLVFGASQISPSPRLPRTSASQLNSANNLKNGNLSRNGTTFGGNLNPTLSGLGSNGYRGNQRNREQYLLNVFEVIVSTLESKLQRIDNLDKAVEHLMRRVETINTRLGDNIDRTDAVLTTLRKLDTKLTGAKHLEYDATPAQSKQEGRSLPPRDPLDPDLDFLGSKLVSLDQKVSDIDHKLIGLKHQLDNNLLPSDEINAEASERNTINTNIVDIQKALSNDVMHHMTAEMGQLDRKLQLHVSVVSENLGKVLNMMQEVHDAVVEESIEYPTGAYRNLTTTTPLTPSIIKGSKLDSLFKNMKPIINVSEKMDEVWDVVVGTKSSVDDLVPKSDELLTQTQRQERAIATIHDDLRANTNRIIENLDLLQKQRDIEPSSSLKTASKEKKIYAESSTRPPQETLTTVRDKTASADFLLLDPTIDRLVEYDPVRYTVEDSQQETTISTSTSTSNTYASSTPTSTVSGSTQATTPGEKRGEKPRKGGIIFPSVKNKPSLTNTTFTSESAVNFNKDIKGYSCVDLLNAGMRQSGVYYLQIRGTTYWFLKVYCEQEIAEGGWTVIQRRDDYGEHLRENFNRDWTDYKNGFGDLSREFWLGNENIYMLTNNEDYVLRVELEDFEGNKRYAQYSHFKIYSEGEYYKLEIDGYEGNAGDSLNDPWYGSNNSPFSTYNRDNDRSSLNCASMLKGGWWWKSCGRGLNGLYLNDPQDLTARQGIVWFRWRGWDYTLKKAVMMIKPKGPMSNT